MKLSDQQIDIIEEMSAHFMSVDEIAVMISVCSDSLRRDINTDSSPASIAYQRGKAKTKLAIRKRVVQMATYGSPQAESLVEKYIIDQIKSERDGK